MWLSGKPFVLLSLLMSALLGGFLISERAVAGDGSGKSEETQQGFSILFGGDTYFGEHEFAADERAGEENQPEKMGYGASLEHLRPLLAMSDRAILNLETPILNRVPEQTPKKTALGYPVHAGRAGPTESTLRAAGVTAVSLGNNHAMDYGEEGLAQTQAALDSVGIEHFGAGKSSMEASRPWHGRIPLGDGTLDLFVLSAYAYRAPYDNPLQVYASPEKPGVWKLDGRAMAQQIRQIRSGYPDAFIIALPHWGWNYAAKDETQHQLARTIIKAGADLIIGHGAHCLQEIETFQDHWIVYGLGNFLFNTRGRYGTTGAPPYSLVARLLLRQSEDRVMASVRLYPIVSDNRIVKFQPRPVDGNEFTLVKTLLRNPLPEGVDSIGHFFELEVWGNGGRSGPSTTADGGTAAEERS